MVNLGGIARKLFGSANDRRVKSFQANVVAINALEQEMRELSDEALAAKTIEFRKLLADGKQLDDLLVPAFAVVREASQRVLGLRPFDVQLIGGMILHANAIAEMKTGEGKTLVAALPLYLNALLGKGVHVVIVNDYLAQRDSVYMGRLYGFLGLTTGVIVHGLDDDERRAAYACDITYATNNELGFDYLRDNMKHERVQMVQRDHSYALIDEVDSILIDEARTPLIISGPLDDRSDLYLTLDTFVPRLSKDDYEIDEKQRSASFSEDGNEKLENMLREAGLLKGESLYDIENVAIVHHINNALKAHKLFQREKDYIVRNGEVVIIDESTGRMMPGRRYSDGLHQALEAKERVQVQPENQTLSQITFQNYFRMYQKLAGMTGTASTEAEEFGDVYGLDVIEVPTNLPIRRIDEDDEVYRTDKEKYNAIVVEILDAHRREQPILVGTTSIGKSEHLADLMRAKGFNEFQVLNARYHEQEAYIVSQAGVPGAVTIATNMAGRGTDIQLGGNAEMRIEQELADMPAGPERQTREQAIREDVARLKEKALNAGGLYVLATERHESRRIDNQLRGRSGRQGDPGRSKFFLSLQDDLMRIFGSEQMDGMLQRLGLMEGEAIVHPWINKAVERAQKKVEARNFDIRKNVLKYDEVLNDQRKVIFDERVELMESKDLSEFVRELRYDLIDNLVSQHVPSTAYAEQWDVDGLKAEVSQHFDLDLPIHEWVKEEGIAEDDIRFRLEEATEKAAAQKAERFGPDIMNYVERSIVLQTLDGLWREHIVSLDHLRSVIGFRGYAQRDPLQEYKAEAFDLFQAMLNNLRFAVIGQLSRVEIVQEQQPEPELPPMRLDHPSVDLGVDGFASGFIANGPLVAEPERDPDKPSTWGRIGRNQACPCGSGRKYKHCHGSFAQAEPV
ncbi:preprotein translocase subunit SecA [Bosea sp. SSUT16]|uniref:Protein translocase subunit SecA n=1 Tax=Bosea spartocytisi TaxID=2773451 RepID=A0A927EDA7_9HYPH|nr:preprotein translocase subunit SecA [Bosea spartocytisi]MBD3848837.1 preprotein translocase subunit SecA [Bosea spartocytisi]